ncbi:MAG TPA: MmgE/PrpD family protein, partial [Rhodospirillales bacterium]|nr:MmgE/PrpD family protein [Rhodospirillales bacterium]
MSESLSQHLAALAARPVDDTTRMHAAVRVLDWLGCALLGATAEAGRVLAAYGRTRPAGPSLTIGAGRRDAETAALVNGSLGNIFEMDDVHRTSIVHPGDVVIPAALAVA